MERTICQTTLSLQNVREAVAHTEITSSRKWRVARF